MNLNQSTAMHALCLAFFLSVSIRAAAQNEGSEEDEKVHEGDVIEVIGSHIKRVTDSETLPVTYFSVEDIEDTAAATGDELLRSIPQMGDITFNNERTIGGVNDARGDVSSINLRGIGTGNTLTLLNGRRLVLHPGTQTEDFIPVTTVNSNTLPVAGLRNVQILRDGASAIYGSDAVAGVVNFALKDNYEGSRFSLTYGAEDDTSFDQTTASYITGFNINQGNTHLTLSFNLYHRNGTMASERPFSASHDRREYPGLPDEFIGDTQLNNTSTSSPWGDFQSDGLGRFHLQPDSMSGCVFDVGGGVCADSGSFPADLRFDAAFQQSMTSDVDRANFYAHLTHDLSGANEFFAEFFYYNAEAERIREQSGVLAAQRFIISANAAHNPFGEDVLVRSFRPIDTGTRNIEVDDSAYRFLGGFRGFTGGWDWETAFLHTGARTEDLARNRIRASAFQAAINSTDPSQAYNPFNGADVNNPNTGDTSVNPASVMAPFLVNVSRDSETTLTMYDVRFSNAALWQAPAGDVGVALGFEYRHESFEDDRDDLLDGSTPFIDQITGEFLADSDVLGSSATPDSSGSRNVASAYAEFIVPLATDRAWAQRLEMQLAARYENFSDIGDALKPKLALFWQMNNWLALRGSYSEGFRAPNLPQVFSDGVERANTREDPVVDGSYTVVEIRGGSRDLEPEDSENRSLGLVLQPHDDVTITVDWWRIEQTGVVGILNSQTHLLYDSLLRSQGSFNPAVIRDPVDNEVIQVNNQYQNLSPRTASGVDYSLVWDIESDIGDWTLSLHAAQLKKFEQQADPISALVIAAQDAGNPATPADIVVPGVGDLLAMDGNPEWRGRASLRWQGELWGFGAVYRYISGFSETSVTATVDGETRLLPIASYDAIDVFVDRRIYGSSWLADSRVRLGVTNLSDEDPPLADESFGYFSNVHSNRGRYWYVSLRKNF